MLTYPAELQPSLILTRQGGRRSSITEERESVTAAAPLSDASHHNTSVCLTQAMAGDYVMQVCRGLIQSLRTPEGRTVIHPDICDEMRSSG